VKISASVRRGDRTSSATNVGADKDSLARQKAAEHVRNMRRAGFTLDQVGLLASVAIIPPGGAAWLLTTWLLCPSASASFGWPRQRIGDHREYRHAHAYHQRKHGVLLCRSGRGLNAADCLGFLNFERP